MDKDLIFAQVACADICTVAMTMKPAEVAHTPERWYQWLVERCQEENLPAPIQTSIMPEEGIAKGAFFLCWHYLKQVADSQPCFAISALMNQQMLVHYTRAAIIWLVCSNYVRQNNSL